MSTTIYVKHNEATHLVLQLRQCRSLKFTSAQVSSNGCLRETFLDWNLRGALTIR